MDIGWISYTCSLSAFGGGSVSGIVMSSSQTICCDFVFHSLVSFMLENRGKMTAALGLFILVLKT